MNNSIANRILKDLSLLIIEPNQIFRNKLNGALEVKLGSIYTAETLKEAIEIYNTHKIDIILMEINFMGEDIFKFIASLRKINRFIPIVIMSNTKDFEIVTELIRLDINDYLIKPLNVNLLKNAFLNAAWRIYENGFYEMEFPNNVYYNIRKKYLYVKENNHLKELILSVNESKLLDLLIYNRNVLLSKDSIAESIWEDNFEITDEAFKSLLNRLRKKIGKESIKNISGRGYILNFE